MSDFRDRKGNWVTWFSIKDKTFFTNAGRLWDGVNGRCKVNSVKQKSCPTYVGCTNGFQSFQHFAAWCQGQVGYGVPGYDIDKDILLPGNKVYGPEVCAFVPQALNKFLCNSAAIRGEHPQGVCFDKEKNKFMAKIKINGKDTYLGYYNTSEEAAQVYKVAKERQAKYWAANLEFSGDYDVNPAIIEALWNWELLK